MEAPGYRALSPTRLLSSAADGTGAFAPSPGVLSLWLLAVPAPFPATLLLDLLDPSERTRADRFQRPEDRNRFLAAHGQMRLVLAASGAGRAEKLSFAKDKAGKPRLAGAQEALTFNLSHSGDWATLAVAASADVGVDIEAVRPFDDMEDFASRTFAPGEAAGLARLPPPRRQEGFFACWARKEAILKADGRGLGLPLESFEVSVDPDAPPRLHRAEGPATAVAAFGLWDLPPIPGHRAAAAASRDLRPEFFRLG